MRLFGTVDGVVDGSDWLWPPFDKVLPSSIITIDLAAAQIFEGGMTAGQIFAGGMTAGQVFEGGMTAGQVEN